VIGSIAFYFVLQYVLIRQLDETLRSEQQEVIEYVTLHNQLPEIQNTKHQWIIIEKINAAIEKTHPVRVWQKNSREDEMESVRLLVFSVKAADQLYKVSVYKSENETEDLLKLIILVTVAMIGLILLFNYLINRRLIHRIWQPFYHTIEKIRDYQVAAQHPLSLSKEPIDEINLLNESLNSMTQRIHQDYSALRSFTENASHEMQTPLAVIRSKVESLLQDAEGKQQSVQQLLVIEDATLKLSRLHQSLLLLTKLGNRQFVLNEPVNLTETLELKLKEREELFASKELKVVSSLEPVTLPFHQHLAEIMVSNLLNNVIRYTPNAGEVTIRLNHASLSVSNKAINGPLQHDKVFERFYKAENTQEGTGLGLAIIKEICNSAGFRITYGYMDQKHEFTIYFK
jgi:signal transduction histidine kinase